MPLKFKNQEEYEEWKASQLEQNPEKPDELVQKNSTMIPEEPVQETPTIPFPNLITCKDCGGPVSKRADKCPHCGAPTAKMFQRIIRTVFWTLTTLLCLSLVIFRSSIMESFWQKIDPVIIEEYNQHRTRTNLVLKDHNDLISKIRTVSADERSSLREDYLAESTQWESTLNQFKTFTETNYKRIKRVGIQPDYVRENIKDVLTIIKENEMRFRVLGR